MKRSLLVVFALACLLAGGAYAVPLGPDCGTCQGGIYNLTYAPIAIGAVSDVFNLTLTVDTTFYTGSGLFINAVAPKISNVVTVFGLLSAPGGVAGWTSLDGGLDANGCSGAGSGFLCTESTGLGAPLTNSPNAWQWQVTVPHNTLFTGVNEASLKVLFVNSTGDNVGIVSEGVTLGGEVPEAGTIYLVLGGAMLLMAGRFRRGLFAR